MQENVNAVAWWEWVSGGAAAMLLHEAVQSGSVTWHTSCSRRRRVNQAV